MNRAPLVFLKLGGALLTHKDQSASPRSAELRRLVGEIAPAWRERSIRLVLGHGSGSFAHVAAQRSGFLERPDDPLAFAQVAAAARDLSALVVRALLDEDLPALMLPGGLLAAGEDGSAVDLRTELVAGALARGLLPVTYGDAAPRRGLGGGIVSTEPLLAALALALRPARLILATDVDGVYADGPPTDERATARAIPRIVAADWPALAPRLGAARPGVVDVTGGMASKVRQMLDLAAALPQLEIRILSGLRPGAVAAALVGDPAAGGTVIAAG
ncbi:MAG: hypothetical protein IPJ58_14860 [Ardenticatenia bacterium]|nr:hypothetical protein [Ardenticatenia bacterium]